MYQFVIWVCCLPQWVVRYACCSIIRRAKKSSLILRCIMEWKPINSGLMKIRMKGKHINITIIQCYSLNNHSETKSRGFIKVLCRSSVGCFSHAFLVFLMKGSKKRRQKQPGKLMAMSRSQPVNLPSAWPLMNPLENDKCIFGN